MKKTKQKGFTLIELLIVIGIIAILAAAVIIAINPGQQFKQARNATRWSHINSIVNATYSYLISEQGKYPSCGMTGGDPNLRADGPLIDISNCSGDLTDHIADTPSDPQMAGSTWGTAGTITVGGNDYDYAVCDSGCKGYLVGLTAAGNRLIVTSIADESVEEDIIVIQ